MSVFAPAPFASSGGRSLSPDAAAGKAVVSRQRWRMSGDAKMLVLVTAILAAIGIAVLYSASAITAAAEGHTGHHYVLKQLTGLLAGAVAFAIAAKFDAEFLRKLAWPVMIVSIFLMLLTVLPFTESIAPMKNGSRRFLYGGSIQPSEIAKFAIIIWTPMLLIKKGDAVRRLGKGLLPFILVIGLLSLLAVLEPDFSVAMMFCLLMAVLLFVGGARVAHFVFLGALAVPLLFQQLSGNSYVRERVRSFFAAEQTSSDNSLASGVSFQQKQSLIAVGSGQLMGVGFSEGNQQRGWLPLAYNDFIGSVVGEELGFVGIAFLTICFAGYGWLGFRIARNARSPFTALVAIGLTFTTVFTAFIHLGVVIGLLPNTGLTLPFVSYGRTNLVMTLAMTGVLVNIGSSRERVYNGNATDPLAPLAT